MSNKLVAYFSASGVTAKVAETLAEAIGADIFEIEPKVTYTEADLNWMNKNARSTIEMNDPASRPEIAAKRDNMADYDTIFVGFPIWRIAELSQEIDNATERSADVKRFVALVRRYTAIEELTYENVHEFIDRILIHELDKETNTRKIEIFYSFVGRVDTGDKPTESISYFRQIGADVKSYAI